MKISPYVDTDPKVIESMFSEMIVQRGYDPRMGTIEKIHDPVTFEDILIWKADVPINSLVIAGTISQAHDHIRELLSKNPDHKHSDYIIVSGPDSLRGYHDPHGIFCGTWYNRPDILDIINCLRVSSNPNKRKIWDDAERIVNNHI